MLREMFDKQKKLQHRLHGVTLPAMLPERLPMTITSIVAELAEVLDEQQAWNDALHVIKEIDYDNLDTEVADVWHFVINLSLYLNFDADDIGDLELLFTGRQVEMQPRYLPIHTANFVLMLGKILEEQQAWKDWKKNPNPPHHKTLQKHVTTLWHYMVSMTAHLGYDAERTYAAFNKKNATNHVRQDSNY